MPHTYFSKFLSTDKRKEYFIVLCLLLTCYLTYGNSLNNAFLMDDYPMLIENRSLGSLSFLQLDFRSLEDQAYFRPVTHMLNLITYSVFGTRPLGYHLINLSLFALAGIALYDLLCLLLKHRGIAFLTALLFCTHPINGVAVNYKNATSFPLLILAILLSLINFLTDADGRSRMNDILSLVWFAVALLCHETAIAYPLYLASILFFIKKYSLKKIAVACTPFIAMTFLYLLFRMYLLGPQSTLIANILSSGMSAGSYLASFTRLILWYLSKLLFMQGIVLAWSTPVIETGIVFYLIILTSGALICIFIFRKYRKYPNISFALSWLLIGFVPVSLACFSRPLLGFVIQPHWLFFSSIGFSLLLALGLVKARERIALRWWVFILAGLLLYTTGNSFRYNYRWGNQERYCLYWLTVSPYGYWPNFWLGYDYLENGQYEKAKEPFSRTLGKGVDDFLIYGNLGIIEYSLKNFDTALAYFRRSLELKPDMADTYYYMGDIYLRKEDLKTAEMFLLEAVMLDRFLIDAKKKLAVVYHKQGRYIESEKINREILSMTSNGPKTGD